MFAMLPAINRQLVTMALSGQEVRMCWGAEPIKSSTKTTASKTTKPKANKPKARTRKTTAVTA